MDAHGPIDGANMSKKCAKCEKTVYPTEELKCLEKVREEEEGAVLPRPDDDAHAFLSVPSRSGTRRASSAKYAT